MKTNEAHRPTRPKPTSKNMSSLRSAIKLFGGSRRDLAEAVGVSRVVVGSWCSGNHAVSIRCAMIIEKKTNGAICVLDLIPDLK